MQQPKHYIGRPDADTKFIGSCRIRAMLFLFFFRTQVQLRQARSYIPLPLVGCTGPLGMQWSGRCRLDAFWTPVTRIEVTKTLPRPNPRPAAAARSALEEQASEQRSDTRCKSSRIFVSSDAANWPLLLPRCTACHPPRDLSSLSWPLPPLPGGPQRL